MDSLNIFADCLVSLKEKSYFCRRMNIKFLNYMTK